MALLPEPAAQASGPSDPLPLRLRVARKSREAEGIWSFELVDDRGGALPAFEAGAHIDIQTPAGPLRQYSLMNPLDGGRRYRIGVLLDPASRGGSTAMHARTAVGDVLAASLPRNHFSLDASAAHTLLLAGGIGVTPLLAMAEQLHAADRSFTLHYGARSRDRMAFEAALTAAPYAGCVNLHLDDGPQTQRLDLAAALARSAPASHLYACGPAGFLAAVKAQAEASGWAPERVHFEHFGNVIPTEAGSPGDAPFEVQIASSGRVIPVARDQSVAQALEACGIAIAVSCEQGVCGTCLTRVIDGVPLHRDVYLTDAEHAANDQFTPCCSRSRSARLVLDL